MPIPSRPLYLPVGAVYDGKFFILGTVVKFPAILTIFKRKLYLFQVEALNWQTCQEPQLFKSMI